MTARRLDTFSPPGVASRNASIGSTLVARRAGTSAAATVTSVPTSIETTMVRGSSCSDVLGRLKPTASMRTLRPLATPRPIAMPIADAAAPSTTASMSRPRSTWRRVAPMARSRAISRDRCVMIIVNVFQMMKPPTKSAMPAKIMNRIPTIFSSSLMASAFSFETEAPVTASVPSGRTALMRSLSSFCAMPSFAATPMRVERTRLAEHLLRRGRVEVRRRGAAEVLLAAEPDGADDGELLGRTLEEHLDRRAQLDVVLLGAGGIDHHLVTALGGSAGEELDLAAEGLVLGHGVAHGRGPTTGEDGLAVVVGDQGVATDEALGDADAVDGRDAVEHRRRRSAPGWCRRRTTR